MSSKSKSRSKSSRNPKRVEKPGDLRPVIVPDTDGGNTNMLAMVLGMVTTFILVFGVFGLGGDEVVNVKYTAEQQKRKKARDEVARADSLEEMMITLSNLKKARPTSLLDSVNICRSRIDLSQEIIERGPSDEAMRETAICEGLLARVKLYGLDFTSSLDLADIGEDLEAAYTPYLEDPNREVYSSARVALLTHRSFEQMKSGNEDVDELVKLFAETIKRFPEDEYVASMIEAHMLVLSEKDPRYTSMLFSRLREKNPPGTLKPVMERKMHNIADRELLKAENFDQKFANRWANGKAGRRDLIKTTSKLLSGPDIGLMVIKDATRLADWFERHEFLEEAEIVFQEIASSVANGNVIKEYRQSAKRISDSGLTRLKLQDQIVSFRGIDANGKMLLDDKLKEKVVIVVFWSARSPSALSYLDALNETAGTLQNKAIAILAICVDAELPKDINVVSQAVSVMQIVESNFESGKNSLLAACPPGSLPHVMLVDFGGKVQDINADPSQIKNKALSLLLNRNR